ncbi:hypothetical protein [Nocardia sp. 348MFTsu5.1]|uniref:hypothetical protein n=1 Tax=Nocardia sp. 348MFTsu5.1 TaxID=1172185 RepID=UPI000491F866|nr:hypothetical protein [Nocardia sp. 348MFTsu5.1]
MSSAVRTAVVLLAAVSVLVGGLYLVGVVNPVPKPPVTGDVLGPENSEPVADYLARAEKSLSGPDTDRWALISLRQAQSLDDGWALTATQPSMLLSQNIFNVPIERVQTPSVRAATGNTEDSFHWSQQIAAQQVTSRSDATERARQVGAVAAARLRAGCECLIGLVVRDRLSVLRQIAAEPGVRAVEALPDDAAAGLFAVIPLQPSMVTIVEPLPDDGPVPAA